MPVRPDAGRRRAPARPTTPTLAASWEAMPWSMRILRAFLGGTFVFAGRAEVPRPELPARRQRDLHRHAAPGVRPRHAGGAADEPPREVPVGDGRRRRAHRDRRRTRHLARGGSDGGRDGRIPDQPDPVALRHLAHPPVLPGLGLDLRGRMARVAGRRARGGAEPIPRTDALARRAGRPRRPARGPARRPDRGRVGGARRARLDARGSGHDR